MLIMHACDVKFLRKKDGIPANHLTITINKEPLKRTLEEIKRLCHWSKVNYGCINEPLLNIPLTNVIADELHLLLRITDKLLENIIDKVLEKDTIKDFNKP